MFQLKKFNLLSAVMLMAIAASLLACAKKLEFEVFRSAPGRFEIATPVALAHQAKTLDFEDAQVTMHSYAGEVDDVVYALNYFDIPEQINEELSKQRPSPFAIPGRDAMLKENGWKAIEIKGDALKVAAPCKPHCEATGEHFKVITNKQVIYVRLLWLRNRIYQIMTAHPKKPSYLQETYARKFSWSLKILPAD